MVSVTTSGGASAASRVSGGVRENYSHSVQRAAETVQQAIPQMTLGTVSSSEQSAHATAATGNGVSNGVVNKRGRVPKKTLDQKEAEAESATKQALKTANNRNSAKRGANKRNSKNNTSSRSGSHNLTNQVAAMSVDGVHLQHQQPENRPEGANCSSSNAASNGNQYQGERAKTQPLFSTEFQLSSGDQMIILELIRNSKNEIFLIMRNVINDEMIKRVAIPFSMVYSIIEKISESIALIQKDGTSSLVDNIKSNNVTFLNMLQETSGFSSYYMDFMIDANEQLLFKISEKKRQILSKTRRSYEMKFNIDDLTVIHAYLSSFYNDCIQFMESEKYEDLPPKLYRSNNFSFEWITRNNMIMLLKVYDTNNRIFFPMNVCRSVQAILKKISDLFDQYGKNHEAYFQIMKEEREDLNKRRIQRGLDALPEYNHSNYMINVDHPSNSTASPPLQENSSNSNEVATATPVNHPCNRNHTLYSTRIYSPGNSRSYHFDLVLMSGSNEVKLRLVEVIHDRNTNRPGFNKNSSSAATNSNANSQTQKMRHNLYIPIDQKNSFCDTFDHMVDIIPLPQEEAFFFQKMRCFVKFNIRRGRGLMLKIKTQQALNPREIQELQEKQQIQNQTGENQIEIVDTNVSGQQKFGHTEILELPVQLVHKIYKYLETNCPF